MGRRGAPGEEHGESADDVTSDEACFVSRHLNTVARIIDRQRDCVDGDRSGVTSMNYIKNGPWIWTQG